MTKRLFLAPSLFLLSCVALVPSIYASISGFEVGPSMRFYHYEELAVQSWTPSSSTDKDEDKKWGSFFGANAVLKIGGVSFLDYIYVDYATLNESQRDDFFEKGASVISFEEESDESKRLVGIKGTKSSLDSFHKISAGLGNEFVIRRLDGVVISADASIGAGMNKYDFKSIETSTYEVPVSAGAAQPRVTEVKDVDVKQYFADISAALKASIPFSPTMCGYVSGGIRFNPVFKHVDDVKLYKGLEPGSVAQSVKPGDESKWDFFTVSLRAGVSLKGKGKSGSYSSIS